jgi:hypothetical protein
LSEPEIRNLCGGIAIALLLVMMIFGLLVEGAVGAVPLIAIAYLLSRFTRDILGRSLLVGSLFIAAAAYFGFAAWAGAAGVWILIELLQVLAFGAAALLGLRGSPYWIAAGWALHPLWDIGVHYVGPGNSFTPMAYPILCGAFDLVVVAYVALAYGIVGSRRLKLREVVPEELAT